MKPPARRQIQLTPIAAKNDAPVVSMKPNGSNAGPGQWPAGSLENVPNCPVCVSSRRQLAYAGLTDQVFHCAPGQWNLFRCEGCGSAYLDPRPTLATIGLAYSNYYTHTQTGSVKPGAVSWWRQRRISQRNHYLNKYYGYDLKPAAQFIFFMSGGRRRRFDRYAGYLRFPGPGARLLDIGCGNGSFLWQMRSLGWEVCGVEPDPKSAEPARAAGLEVRAELLPQQPWPEGHFDAITMFHVVEHLYDPVHTLIDCCKLLKPGGQLVIATPNYGAIGREFFGCDWRGLEIPRHLVLFTEKSLWEAMERSGFAVSRPARPSLNARAMFKLSLNLRREREQSEPPVGSPKISRWQREWLAFKADRATKADPRHTEELILLGIRTQRP